MYKVKNCWTKSKTCQNGELRQKAEVRLNYQNGWILTETDLFKQGLKP